MNQKFYTFFPVSIIAFSILTTGCSQKFNHETIQPNQGSSGSMYTSDKPNCMSLMDNSGYEMIEGFNGDGYYVSGYVAKNRKQRPEGCFVDDWGKEEWFVGDWISSCQIEGIDAKGQNFDLQTDDCWTERGFL